MGGQSFKQNLTSQEIDDCARSNPSLQSLFNQYKNSSGVLTLHGLENLLDKKINQKIAMRLIKITGSESNQMTFEDLKYLYGLFRTNKFDAKVNFIADLIFFSENSLKFQKYLRRLEKTLGMNTDIYNSLSGPIFFDHTKIEKEIFIREVTHKFKTVIDNFSFIKDINTSQQECHCFIEQSQSQPPTQEFGSASPLEGEMEKEFQTIEKNNNGIFPISYFEEMLNELGLNKNFVSMICSYLKRKTQKSFLCFDIFKTLLTNLSQRQEEILSMQIFEIFSYPKDYFKKSDLVMLFKSLGKELSDQNMSEYHITKDKIDSSLFNSIFKVIYSLLSESLERLKYLQYVYFHVRPNDVNIEKNCIEILMKGKHRDLKQYIDEISLTESQFYLIDFEFWEKWQEHVNCDMHNNCKEDDNDTSSLRIHTDKFCNVHGKVLDDMEYLKDFLILPPKIYELFSLWYGNPQGPEVKREKIYLKDNEGKGQSVSVSVSVSPIYGEEGKMKYEIEIYPIYIAFIQFEDIISANSMTNMKEQLKIIASSHNTSTIPKYLPYSRKSKYKDIFISRYSDMEIVFNSRLWVYYSNKFCIASLEKSIEDDAINDSVILLVEKRVNKAWQSEMISHDFNITPQCLINPAAFAGLENLGNTCYMNSVLQTFLNNFEISKFFMVDNVEMLFNYNNLHSNTCELLREFVNLLYQKWGMYGRKVISPIKWKKVIGKVNPNFDGKIQQDAHDYFNFMLDSLHEEIDLKSKKEYIPCSETFDGTEEELAGLYWANNLRRNASFIHSLFLGQLKSTLKCQKCKKSKTSYETFSSLSLPIPQNSRIVLEVLVFRLPFTYKVYYENLSKYQSDGSKDDIRSLLELIRKKSFGYNLDINNPEESCVSILANAGDCEIMHDVHETHMSKLTTNIPIRVKIEIERKQKVRKILMSLKQLYDLELEQENIYTTLLLVKNEQFIDQKLTIDECVSSNPNENTPLYVYELLNSNGIRKIFKYTQEESPKAQPLANEIIQSFFDITSSSVSVSNKVSNFEFLVRIVHCYSKPADVFFINNYGIMKLATYFNCMILTKRNPIRASHLYELIWAKFEYYLNNPTKFENSLWWKVKDSTKFRKCCPFVIKIVNKFTYACSKCPWHHFCLGCTIDPFANNNFIEISPDDTILVQWCSEIAVNEINYKNLKQVIHHSSVDSVENITRDYEKTIHLQDCVSLFTETEDLGESQMYCSNCLKKTYWWKKYEIERLPNYLVIALKRFKFTQMYRSKIDSLISFPLTDLDMSEFMCNHDKKFPRYDLYAVVNHSGSLNSGHYTSIVKQELKWVKYNDSRVFEIEESNVMSPMAYILIYKVQEGKSVYCWNYLDILSEAYRRDIKSIISSDKNEEGNSNLNRTAYTSISFIPGEPVKSVYGRGYILSTYAINEYHFAHVKLNQGSAYIRTDRNAIQRETVFLCSAPIDLIIEKKVKKLLNILG